MPSTMGSGPAGCEAEVLRSLRSLRMTESGRQGDSAYLRGWDDYERQTLKLTLLR